MEKSGQKPSAKWHAVVVVLRTASCAAAAQCRNTKFLSKEAPRLPLQGCDNPDGCPCTYRHFEDRRAGPRRSDDIKASGSGSARRDERRETRGRRAKDKQR